MDESRTRIGAVLLCLGTVQFFLAHLVVQSAWPTPYSWVENYISDLGAVRCDPGDPVCSPLHAVMNAGFVLQGALLIAGTVLTAGAWPAGAGRRLWQGLVVVSGVSWIVVGLVPEDVNPPVHAAGALPGFVASNVALLVAAASPSTRARRVCRWAAAVLGVVGVVGLVLMAAGGWPVGIGAAERLVVFPLQVWALVVGGALVSFRHPDGARSTPGPPPAAAGSR